MCTMVILIIFYSLIELRKWERLLWYNITLLYNSMMIILSSRNYSKLFFPHEIMHLQITIYYYLKRHKKKKKKGKIS